MALTLQTPLPNATCFVFASRTLHPNPAGYQVTFMGMTDTFQLQFWGPDVIAFADPGHTFGQSISDPTTDAYGDWCFPFNIPNDPSLVNVTFHGEGFVTDGVTHYDSNLVTIQIQ